MESSRLPLPESFDKVAGLNQAEQWPKWSRRFERYRIASGLASKPDSEQVSTLLYAMGECADDIIVSLNVKEETAKYDDVIATLKKYFNVRKNIIVERAKFNKRTQRPGESVDTFINDLYRLAEDCDYDRLKEGLIRDRIVVGVLDDSLSDQLQSREDLTLSKAVQLSRQSEARKQNKSVVRGGAESESPNSAVNYVRPKSKGTYSKKTSQTPQGNCKWCGRQNHARASCPAKDAKCHQCGKMGHFQSVCQAKQPEQGKQEVREPLMSSSFPSRPWERLGMDLFELKGKSFLIVVDYYSRWIEVKQLQGQSTMAVISSLKEIFAVHGIPDLVVSDNGPQFANENFRKLAEEYGFVHTTSSPRYPQANGEAERGVRTVKALLKKNDDIQLALLSYRASPLQNGLAPCELLMGRRLQTQVPTLPHMLLPRVQQPDLTTVREKEEKYRSDQMMTYNRRHDSRELPELQPGDSVWIRDQSRYGKVTQKAQQPRSYHVQTEHGTVRRNRRALIAVQGQPTKTRVPESSMSNDPERPDDSDESDSTGSQRNQQINRKQPEGASTPTAATETRTRSGRLVKPPKRLSM
eukprot:XP_011673187.1 PREDICTED: uncharacterized protein K02A2.6-like [Strongylocentrotus purpuratus]